MALEFQRPPDWLIQEYVRRKSPFEEASDAIQTGIQNYAVLDQSKRKNALAEQEIASKQAELGMKGREQFYNYGDTGSLPQDVQAQIGQPAQGPGYPVNVPPPEGTQGPSNQQTIQPQVPSLIERYNQFLQQNPAGLKGGERKMNQDLQQSEVEKNLAQADMLRRSRGPGAAPQAKPQLRQNAFTGNYEWYQPPESAGPGVTTPGVQPGTPTPSHGPGTFRDVSKAAGAFAEDKVLVEGVIGEISRVKELNKNSRGGIGGSLLQKGQSALNMGTDSPEFKNTADVINTLKGAVARVLKSTFGGQLSDDERRYLNEVYGAAEKMSPAEREIAMTNVETMLRNKVQTSGAKYGALSGNAPSNTMQAPTGGPAIGTVEDGHRFKGGNPSDPSSWEPVQ